MAQTTTLVAAGHAPSMVRDRDGDEWLRRSNGTCWLSTTAPGRVGSSEDLASLQVGHGPLTILSVEGAPGSLE